MSTQEISQLKSGYKLSKEIVEDILSRCFITRHLVERMRDRCLSSLVDDNPKKTRENISKLVDDKFTIAYINTDGSINIAISNYEYFVVESDKYNQNRFRLVTFKEKSKNNVDIFQKLRLAEQGIGR